MPTAASAHRAPKPPGTPLAETMLIVGLSVAAFAAAHAVEGVVGIARDIFGGTPSEDGAVSSEGRSPGPRPSADPGSRSTAHQAAGLVLIVGAACTVRLVRRLLADLIEAVRDIGGGARPAQGVRRATKAAGAVASSSGSLPVRRQPVEGHAHVKGRVRTTLGRRTVPSADAR
ncbi:hypothetical protein [Streptacidiphilus melanogenes]|uniref:hypothetical protein n=1 Tax=Streptacidiphilus melanogenes TaxID=411235 RepID=UPI00126A2610|nr:hypothetical protein [Streptacidiphilus melanogenes]